MNFDRQPRVLIIEDEHALAAALASVCRSAGTSVTLTASAAAGTRALAEAADKPFRLVILDIGLPDRNGLELLKEIGDTPVLVITAHGNFENAVEAKRRGASDYLVKPLDLGDVEKAVLRLVRAAPDEPAGPAAPSGAALIGGAPAMQPVFRALAHACATTMPAIVTGPTGSGKSLAAAMVHRNSAHSPKELVVVSCGAALAGERLEASIQEARGGTLVLEDIDALPLPLHARVAGELESGGTRIVATARADLREAVAAGTFSEDLYYRLHIQQIAMPPLRRRSDDIPALSAYLLGGLAPGRPLELSREVLRLFRHYRWPGNVRELRDVLAFAVSVCRADRIDAQHLPPSFTDPGLSSGDGLPEALARWLDERLSTGPVTYAQLLDEVESQMLAYLLARFDHKPTHLAEALGLNRTTLRQKQRRLLDGR